MKTISKNTVLAAYVALFAPFFLSSSVAQNTPVPPAECTSVLFQTTDPYEVSEEINLVLPGFDQAQTVTVTVRDGIAFFEDDIELGSIEELRNQANDRSIRIDAGNFRWPNAQIPFTIGTGFTAEYVNVIRQAIDYINAATHILIMERTTETSFITFNPASGCSSHVGRQTGQQFVNLQDPNLNGGVGCGFKAIIHEVAHAAGIWHEQSREDRNNFITIQWANIQAGREHNFNQQITDATDVGPYDFASDMHYSATAFSSNGQPTITANGGQTFGNATEYSVGDVAGINSMYVHNICSDANTLFSAEMPSVSRALHFEHYDFLESSSLLNTGCNITYDAGLLVKLLPGFVAKEGIVFRAAIDGCGGNIQSLAGPEVDEWMSEIDSHQHQDSEISTNPVKTDAAIIQLSAYPNPVATTTSLLFTLPAAAVVNLGLFDLTGKSVLTLVDGKDFPVGQQQVLCPMTGLAPGVYFARLNAGSGMAILKIIKVE